MVSIRPKESSSGFVLRDAADANRDRLDERANYKARVRLRGPYGLGSPIRVFVTIPVNVVGVRFPASPSDLNKSSDSPLYQSTTLTAGVAVALEPWNYALGRNGSRIPFRVSGGMNFIALSDKVFAPSLVVGAAFVLPVIEGPTAVSSAVSLGAYYENDLREQHPLETGHRLLLTFGFNLFSLLSPQTTPPSTNGK